MMIDKILNQHITVLVEPTAQCNIRCKHCYHAKTNYDGLKMSKATLDKFLATIAPYYKSVSVIWHGGEPLLAGYDFFVYAYKRFEHYAKTYGTEWHFKIQTNGTLLNEQYVELFLKTDTHVSISYDGAWNSVLRQKTEETERAIDLLKASGAPFAALSTVSSKNVNHLIELYEFFKKLDVSAKFNAIIPDGAANDNKEYVLTKEEWASNFIRLFEYWFYDKDCNIYLSSCCDVLKRYLRAYRLGCICGRCMFRFLAVDARGDIYPCGRSINPDMLLENVYNIDDIRLAFNSKKYSEILEKNRKRMDSCKSCKWFGICNSGCNSAANLNNDLTKPFEFDCYFNHKVFGFIESLLKNYDINKVNKYVKDIIGKYSTC